MRTGRDIFDECVREAVRARRELDGDVAAVGELRGHHPRASLVDAKRWVDRL